MAYSLTDLANQFGCHIAGDPDTKIFKVCTLRPGVTGGISFLANRRYGKYLAKTNASAVIVKQADVKHCPVPALIHENPYACYARIATYLTQESDAIKSSIHPSAVIHETVNIGNNVSIGSYVVIEGNVTIGDNSYIGSGCVLSKNVNIGEGAYLHSNITIYRDCYIGKRALIHAGVVIGADGFGFAWDNDQWVKVPQLGGVTIGDDVEIGANTTIDRGTIDNTIIGNGVKLDNQVQIAHNVKLGDNSAIAACVGIAGSTVIGRRCVVGGMVGISGHIELVDDVHITARSGVSNSIKSPGRYSSGVFLLEYSMRWKRNMVRFSQLDDMAKQLKNLERSLNSADQSN